MKRFARFIQPMLISILYVLLGLGLISGEISFFVYGCSILIEFLALAILFTISEAFGPPTRNQASVNVLVATILMCMILYALIYSFAFGLDEIEIGHLNDENPALTALAIYHLDLLLISVGVFVSYGGTVLAIALPKRAFQLEGLLIRKAFMVFGMVALFILAVALFESTSRLYLAFSVVSIRLLLESIELRLDLKT